MAKHPLVAALLALTALVVIVAVIVQAARKEFRLRDGWPHLLIALGMLVVAAGYALAPGRTRGYLAGAGFVTALLGMLALQRRT